MNLRIVRDAIARSDLAALAARQFGDIVKAVVDVDRGIMAVGGDLHSDDEAALLEDGSRRLPAPAYPRGGGAPGVGVKER